MSDDFYVYLHKRLDSGETFYVGKGKGRRAWSTRSRNKHWSRISKKHGFSVSMVETGMDETSAFDLEVSVISRIGRGNLCNATDGGDGPTGAVRSKETRRKISLSNMGKPSPRKGVTLSDETKAKISESKTGSTLSESQRAAMSAMNKGIRNPFYGKKHSDETRRKISEMRMGTEASPETKEKLRLARANRVGVKAPAYSDKIHVFKHETHGEYVGTQYDLRMTYGLPQSNTSALVRGKQKICQGWTIQKETE